MKNRQDCFLEIGVFRLIGGLTLMLSGAKRAKMIRDRMKTEETPSRK
jgi:hypothetical protein